MDEQKPAARDRRAALRVGAAGSVPGQLFIDQEANVVQISMGGVMVETPAPFSVGSEHQLILSVGEREQKLIGVVRNCRPLLSGGKSAVYRVGIEFVKGSEDQREFLGEFVNEKLEI